MCHAYHFACGTSQGHLGAVKIETGLACEGGRARPPVAGASRRREDRDVVTAAIVIGKLIASQGHLGTMKIETPPCTGTGLVVLAVAGASRRREDRDEPRSTPVGSRGFQGYLDTLKIETGIGMGPSGQRYLDTLKIETTRLAHPDDGGRRLIVGVREVGVATLAVEAGPGSPPEPGPPPEAGPKTVFVFETHFFSFGS